MFRVEVLCGPSLDLEHRLLLSIPSHTVEVLAFQSKVSSGKKHKAKESLLKITSEVGDSLQSQLCFKLTFCKTSVNVTGRPNCRPPCSIHPYECSLSYYDVILFQREFSPYDTLT